MAVGDLIDDPCTGIGGIILEKTDDLGGEVRCLILRHDGEIIWMYEEDLKEVE